MLRDSVYTRKHGQVSSAFALPQRAINIFAAEVTRFHPGNSDTLREYFFDFFRRHTMLAFKLINHIVKPDEAYDSDGHCGPTRLFRRECI
jgi:hypothetical protein